MKEYGLYESAAVKVQTLKTAIEVRSPSSFILVFNSLLIYFYSIVCMSFTAC